VRVDGIADPADRFSRGDLHIKPVLCSPQSASIAPSRALDKGNSAAA
jgi:hypothetical protein